MARYLIEITFKGSEKVTSIDVTAKSWNECFKKALDKYNKNTKSRECIETLRHKGKMI